MAGQRNASQSLVVEDSEVIYCVTRCALPIIVTVVAVVRAHRTSQTIAVLLKPWLTNVFASAYQSQVVALNTGGTDFLTKAHRTFPRA